MVLTSNRTRELHDALKRRCLYHWIGYPPAEREVEIVLVREPGVAEALARKVVAAVNRLRELDLAKPPGVAETIDWVRTLDFLGETELTPQERATRSARSSRNATTSTSSGTTWRRSPPVAEAAAARECRSAGCWSDFARELRAAGLTVGTGDLLTYCAAMSPAGPDRPAGPVLGRPGHAGQPAG